jgi:formate dehydrogenase subunit delta
MTTTTHGTEPDRLVKMANQIGDFFKSYPEATAIEGVRDHIAKFWNKKMRDELFAAIDAHSATGLAPLVEKAIAKLR